MPVNWNGPAPVVLGENMDERVTPYARSIGATTIVDWLGDRKWTKELNDAFIEHIKSEGLEVRDIGPDYPRLLDRMLHPPAGPQFPPVYPTEQWILGAYTRVVRL